VACWPKIARAERQIILAVLFIIVVKSGGSSFVKEPRVAQASRCALTERRLLPKRRGKQNSFDTAQHLEKSTTHAHSLHSMEWDLWRVAYVHADVLAKVPRPFIKICDLN
jgi:hypothetical protein